MTAIRTRSTIRALGIRFEVPMREALYNRHVAFSCADGGVWSEPVQPLIGRRVLTLNKSDEKPKNITHGLLQQQQMEGKRIPEYEAFDKTNQNLIDNWASWDGYRLSQSNADAFTIRKRANADNPWIGTFSGTRSDGYAFVGDISGGLGLRMLASGSPTRQRWRSTGQKARWQNSQHGFGVLTPNRWTCATTTMWLTT